MEKEYKILPDKRWIKWQCDNCPKCKSEEADVLTNSSDTEIVFDQDEARCSLCGHEGYVSVEDSECADIIWNKLS